MKNITALISIFLLFSTACNTQIEAISNCDSISIVHELSLLNGYSFTMNPPAGEIFYDSFCNNAGDIDNPNWLAFRIEPHFIYSIDVEFSNCIEGIAPLIGGQIAIYSSCDLSSEAVYCYSGNAEENVIIPTDQFDSNNTYYMIIDGYGGSVCDVEFSVDRYLPLATTTDWYNSAGSFGGSSQYWYSDIGDTLINGVEYRIIENYPLSDFPFNRFIRENNNRKVYEYNVFTLQEQLLYDFNATIGDELELSVGKFTVTDRDEVQSEVGALTRWKLDGPGPPIYVTEGIGSEDLFLSNTASDPVYNLLCAYHKSDKIFGNENCTPAPRWIVDEINIMASICEGESYFFGNTIISSEGIYIDSLTNINGADSIVTLELSVLPLGMSNIQETLCPGETYIINGIIFDENSPTGNVVITNGAANGCDSIINVELQFLNAISENYQATICEGSSEIWAGDTITLEGDYIFNLTSSFGCDSIINLSVDVIPDINTQIILEECEGKSVVVDGVTYTESGNFVTEYEAANGCDSVVNLTIDFLPVAFASDTIYFCPNDTIEAGIYEEVTNGVNGCDSVTTIYAIELLPSDPECTTNVYDLEKLTLNVSPNPFTNSINISSEEIMKSLEIKNIAGVTISINERIDSQNYTFNGDQLPAGVYILTVRSEDKIAIQKIVRN